MMPESPSLPPSSAVHRRFVVSWRNVTTRATSPIGMLSLTEGLSTFDYLATAPHLEGFRPLFGFSDFNRRYRSTHLFPIFSQRIMDPRRPDYAEHMVNLGLPPDASGLDALSRSGGRRKADSIQIVEVPSIDSTGRTVHDFFVRGVRYAAAPLGEPPRELGELRVHETLSIVPEPENPVNSSALTVANREGARIGWIPDLLLPYVASLEARDLRVLRINGPDVPPYLRVLVRISGVAPNGYQPFTGPDWTVMDLGRAEAASQQTARETLG